MAEGKVQGGQKGAGHPMKNTEFLNEDDGERFKRPRSGCSWHSSAIIYCSTRPSPYINSAKGVDCRFCKCVRVAVSSVCLYVNKYGYIFFYM